MIKRSGPVVACNISAWLGVLLTNVVSAESESSSYTANATLNVFCKPVDSLDASFKLIDELLSILSKSFVFPVIASVEEEFCKKKSIA